ncbi:MAG: putative esterase of the alpha-beta hydrolase superfamily [Ilumatobacteraceae bacterium]|nr:putative esterase of the alpha-beta hydrolase superfamily [Ilumatobacteraceae bacterium]
MSDGESGSATRIGLVLGAGGVAGGAFHAGVLAALEQAMHWDPRTASVIVGTSAGSITATSLRAGLSASDGLAHAQGHAMSPEGEALLRSIGPVRRQPLRPAAHARRPKDIAASLAKAAARPFTAAPWTLLAGLLPEGSVSTEFISSGIAGIHPGPWPDEPLWICTVRQGDGRRVVFGRHDRTGPLADVVAASCAIPGFFSPVTVDGDAYVDGGLHSPTNADLLADKALGLDLVLVSSPMSASGSRLRMGRGHPVRRWSGALLDAEVLRLRRRGIPAVAFQPTEADVAMMGSNAMDPTRRAAIAAQAKASTLRRLARSDTQARLTALRP